MISVSQYEYIRTAHRVYGKSIREIARETGHSRNTVKKVLKGEYQDYTERNQQEYPVLGDHLSTIGEWLEGDRDVPKKQRHTARRIYHRLQTECGYTGSESAVRRYVREFRLREGIGEEAAFIPLNPAMGQEAEVDWGSAEAVIGGKEMTIKFFCMRSKYSGKHFVQCYPCERQEMFFDGHIKGFQFFGGVFPVLIYDNLTAAVRKVLQGKDRNLQESYAKFQGYYNFTPRFCNVGKGHEKGGVEGLVGFARRNYMVPVPQASDFAALNEKILQDCINYGNHRISGRDKSVSEHFEEEKGRLITLPAHPYTNIRMMEGKADKYATVLVDKNRYSVPARYAGILVRALVSVNRVELYKSGQLIASHARIFGEGEWRLNPDHYLDLLRKRPQAFESARPIQQWRPLWPPCLESLLERFQHNLGYTRGVREFITVLMLYRQHRPEDVQAAVELALENHAVTSEDVKHLLLQTKQGVQTEPLKGWPSLPAPDLSVYDRIGGGS